MCSHYQILKDIERLRRHFGLDLLPDLERLPPHAWKDYVAPFIRRIDAIEHRRELVLGQFQLVPDGGPLPSKYSLFNARAEEVANKRSYMGPWKRGQRCIIPAEWIVEPCYETGKHVPWRIFRADGAPMGIAGIWNRWTPKEGPPVESFTMLTVNADDHPFMKRFHKPQDEKRMVVLLEEADYGRWLDCPPEQMKSMMQPCSADVLEAEPTT